MVLVLKKILILILKIFKSDPYVLLSDDNWQGMHLDTHWCKKTLLHLLFLNF